MFRKVRVFILIPALLLIPLLLGTIPLKLMNKVAHGGPFADSRNKQECCKKDCPSHSLITQINFDTAVLDALSSGHEILHLLEVLNAGSALFSSDVILAPMPLRC
jgi:hypothetical protein